METWVQVSHVSIYDLGLRLLGVSINGGTPIAGWFIKENTVKMDDLGVLLFQETSIYTYVWLNYHNSLLVTV